MVLIYKTEDNEYFTLAELAQKFPKEWAYCLKHEIKFLGKLNLVFTECFLLNYSKLKIHQYSAVKDITSLKLLIKGL